MGSLMGLRWEIKICNGPCSRRRPEDCTHVKQRGAMYKHCAFAPICCIVCCDIFFSANKCVCCCVVVVVVSSRKEYLATLHTLCRLGLNGLPPTNVSLKIQHSMDHVPVSASFRFGAVLYPSTRTLTAESLAVRPLKHV